MRGVFSIRKRADVTHFKLPSPFCSCSLDWKQKLSLSVLLLLCLLPTLLISIFSQYSFWLNFALIATSLSCLGLALAIFPFFWALFIYGLGLAILLPLELSSMLGIGCAFNYGFLESVMGTTMKETWAAIKPFSLYLILFILLIASYFFVLLKFIPRKPRLQWSYLPIAIVSLLLLLYGSFYLTSYFVKSNNPTTTPTNYVAKRALSTAFPTKYVYLFGDYLLVSLRSRTAIQGRQAFIDTLTVAVKPTDTVIGCLFLGETSRACSWQLAGYPYPTTPRLAHRENVIFFPDAYTAANYTTQSIKRIVFPTTEDLSVDWKASPLVQELAKKAFGPGRTVMVTNQNDERSVYEGYGYLLLNVSDRHFFMDSLRNLQSPPPDAVLIPPMHQVLSSPLLGSHFFTIWGWGGHWFYPDCYPTDDTVFTPCIGPDFNGDLVSPSEDIVLKIRNSYNNTIAHTDFVLDSIISLLEATKLPSFLLYIADHGENLYDDQRYLHHHGDPGGTHYDCHVPLLVWYSDSYEKRYPGAVAAMKNSRKESVSAIDVYSTLLQLLRIHSPWLDSSKSLASPAYVSHKVRNVFTSDGLVHIAPPFPPEERARIDSIIASFQ